LIIKVNIHPYYIHLTNNQDVIEVQGTTVGECLKSLMKQYPDFEQIFFDENGTFTDEVNIFINYGTIFPEELSKPVTNGDELHIIPTIMGG
jgi:molybdopterin converting factor small subunit